MRYADLSDDDDSDLDGFGDYDDYEMGDHVDNSDAESGYEEPTLSSASVPVSESLQDAMSKCRLESVEELISQIENYDAFKLANDFKPLQFAAQLGKPELVDYFLNLEAERGIDNRNLIPAPLSIACSVSHEDVDENHLTCAELLLDAGVDVNFQDMYGVNALMNACRSGTLDGIRLLLSRGARVNDCDNDGWSPLFYAANRGDKEIVDELLKHEAELTKIDKRNRYAYTIAYDKGFSDVAELIKPELVAKAEERALNMVTVKDTITTEELQKEGEPDYFDDVFHMLSGVASDMARYAPLFRDKKVNLRQFLLLKKEDDLKSIGVPLSWHRHTIIERLRQFHLGCWHPKSLGLCEPGKENLMQPSLMMRLLTYMATLRQQMFVLDISMEYFQDDVLKFCRDDPELVAALKSIQARLRWILGRLKLLQKRIQTVKIEYKPRLLAQQVQ